MENLFKLNYILKEKNKMLKLKFMNKIRANKIYLSFSFIFFFFDCVFIVSAFCTGCPILTVGSC